MDLADSACQTQSGGGFINVSRLQLEWGIRPKWLKQVANKEGLINIRAENLSEKPTFRKDLNSHRCLVLADSFYEWKKTTAKQKTPTDSS